MSTAIETEQWLAVHSSEVLEKRTYKSGRILYYIKGSMEKWGRVETSWAEDHWIKNKIFVKEDEHRAIKREAEKLAMRKFWLTQGHIAGGVTPKWRRT